MKSYIIDPMQAGYMCARTGGSLDDNPYELDDIDRYFDWMDGFLDAQVDMDKERQRKKKCNYYLSRIVDMIKVLAIVVPLCILLLYMLDRG